jgi:hypothetical protein
MTGMVLLDASADIDGVTELCHWRKHEPVPPSNYSNLQIVHVPSPAEGTLTTWLRKPTNRTEYAHHILDTVRRHVRTHQKALLVCKKSMVDVSGVPGWSEHMKQFTTKDRAREDDTSTPAFPWDFEGRFLGLTWWGGYGIGANDWHDADAVLLFDDYHLPTRTLIATTQGLLRAKATDEPLASMVAPHSPSEALGAQPAATIRLVRRAVPRCRCRGEGDHRSPP